MFKTVQKNNVTKQTNMLAMNTQIRPRDDEAGKSFQFITGR